MNKHTPGPWGTFAQSVFTDNKGYLCAVSMDEDCNLEEAFANAELIAAAPDMLAALQGVLRESDEFREEHKTDESDCIRAVRAAIALAGAGAV